MKSTGVIFRQSWDEVTLAGKKILLSAARSNCVTQATSQANESISAVWICGGPLGFVVYREVDRNARQSPAFSIGDSPGDFVEIGLDRTAEVSRTILYQLGNEELASVREGYFLSAAAA